MDCMAVIANQFKEQKRLDAERAVFDTAVARRAEALFQDHKTLEAHVEYKIAMKRDPNQRTVSAPRTPSLDALERAYIRKLAEAREIKFRAGVKVQAYHMAKGEVRADLGTAKNASWPALKFRNGPPGKMK